MISRFVELGVAVRYSLFAIMRALFSALRSFRIRTSSRHFSSSIIIRSCAADEFFSSLCALSSSLTIFSRATRSSSPRPWILMVYSFSSITRLRAFPYPSWIRYMLLSSFLSPYISKSRSFTLSSSSTCLAKVALSPSFARSCSFSFL